MIDFPEALPPRTSGLPANQDCLIDLCNPDMYYRSIETPVDDRGLIDVSRLVKVVKECMEPGYQWPSELSVHHLYHPGSWYPDNTEDLGYGVNPHVFRNLAIHKALVPRQFENLLHWVTIEPALPHPEVMRYRVEAWNVAKDLFKMARHTVQWEKMAQRRRQLVEAQPDILPIEFNGEDIIGEEIMEETYDRHFRGIEYQMKRQEAIPLEFRLVPFEATPNVIATRLGKIIMPGSLQLVRSVAS